jgi:hypothetical protein
MINERKNLDVIRNVLYGCAVAFMAYCGFQEIRAHSFNLIDFALTIFISGSVGVRLMRYSDDKYINVLKETIAVDDRLLKTKNDILETFVKEYKEYQTLTDKEIAGLQKELKELNAKLN